MRKTHSRSRSIAQLLLLAFAGGVLACGATGCKRQPAVGGASNPRAEAARRECETTTINGLIGAAAVLRQGSSAAANPPQKPTLTIALPTTASIPSPAPAQPKHDPLGSAYVLREWVHSEVPYPTEAEADEDALNRARARVIQELAELELPARIAPTIAQVKSDFIRPGSRHTREPSPAQRKELDANGYSGNRIYVEYEVQMTGEQVRELRSVDRSWACLRIVGGFSAVALAVFGFLRIDERTKGYLTSWLALIAMGLAGGAAAVLAFA